MNQPLPFRRPCAAILALALVACATTGKGTTHAVSETDAIRGILEEHPGWRLAQPADCTSPLLGRWQQEHSGYHPYRVTADVNGDGRKDLAVGLIEPVSYGAKFHVYWLPGTPDGFGPPSYLGAPDLHDGGIIPIKNGLALGPFYSDAAFTYRWNAATGRLEPDQAEEDL